MKNFKASFLAVVLFCLTSTTYGQTSVVDAISYKSVDYSDCAAIFYNGEMLVNEYSPDGKCQLGAGMRGKLTLSAVTLTESSATPTTVLPFRVAIKHADSNTLWMFTDSAVKEVMLEDIVKECKKGDKIIILTAYKKYSLSHHEIELTWGC